VKALMVSHATKVLFQNHNLGQIVGRMAKADNKIKLVLFQELQLLKDIEDNGGKYRKGGFLSVWNSKADFYGGAGSPLRNAFIARRDRYIRLSLKHYIQELIEKAIPISDITYQKAKKKGLIVGDFGKAVNKHYDPTGQKQAEAAEDEAEKSQSQSKNSLSDSSSSEESSGDESATELAQSVASLSLSGKKSADNPPTPIKRQPRSSAPPTFPTQVTKKVDFMSAEEGASGGKCVCVCACVCDRVAVDCRRPSNDCFQLLRQARAATRPR
jgi:hypothetical protein